GAERLLRTLRGRADHQVRHDLFAPEIRCHHLSRLPATLAEGSLMVAQKIKRLHLVLVQNQLRSDSGPPVWSHLSTDPAWQRRYLAPAKLKHLSHGVDAA